MSYSYAYPHPAVTTDTVVFAIRDEQLQILLIRRASEPYAGQWALPGGFLEIGEGLEDCARRELREETGREGLYLEQLYTFGVPGRDPRERVLSVAYFALLPLFASPELKASSDASAAAWHPCAALPALAFDHDRIVAMALERLRAKLLYSTIALQFMPDRFTLSQLQSVYETILGAPLDKRNFRKRMQGLGCLEETGEKARNGQHRPARLYRARVPDRVNIIQRANSRSAQVRTGGGSVT